MVMLQSAPPPRGGGVFKWIVIGCLGMMLLAGIGIGGCLFAIVKLTAAPVKAGEEFLQAMSTADAAKARGLCEASVPVEDLLKDAPVWGTGWTITGRYINTNNGVTTSTVTASIPGKDGKSRTVELSLIDKGGWKVMGVKIDGTAHGTTAPTAEGAPEIRNVDIQKKKIDDGYEVTVTFAVTGLKGESRGEKTRIAATHGVLLKGPKGQDVIRNDDFKTIDGEGETATFTDTFTLKTAEAIGHWVLHATVRDHLGGQTVTKDIEFDLP